MADNPWFLNLPKTFRPLGDWAERSKCLELCRTTEAETSWWFPTSPAGVPGPWAREVARRTQIAIAACGTCEVFDECRAWALEHGEQGIWAGAGPKQRRGAEKPRTCIECQTMFIRPPRGEGAAAQLCGEECRKARKTRLKKTRDRLARQAVRQAEYRERQKAQAS